MQRLKTYWKEVIIFFLVLSNVFVWTIVYQGQTRDILSVYFLDVGQGDAIFVESPAGHRVLIDGGANRLVVSQLGKILPFADRRIDLVLETHPDKDHIGGLPEVVSRYKVFAFIEPGVESDNSIDDELERRVADKDIPSFIARRGMVIDFKDGAVLTILFPNQDVSRWDTNDASIVARLDYKESSFLLTGDAELRSEGILLSLNKGELDVDVLKVGHHGSRTSTSMRFAEAVTPEYAVISAGKDNRYGHPHEQVIGTLNKIGAEIFSTAEEGTIKFETDGEKFIVK